MPITHNVQILVDNQPADLPEIKSLNLKITYSLEDPENFESKRASMAFDIDLPSTGINDALFNTYFNSKVQDFTPGSIYSNWRPCRVIVNGVEILSGQCIVNSSENTRLPEGYSISIYGNNGAWLLDAKDLTIWDCLSDTPHTFDLATVIGSWDNFDSDEAHDFTYAPVRYRQPFQYADPNPASPTYGEQKGNDDVVNVYMLRPSISIYWLLIRGFRQLGYRVDSQFIESTNYFRRMVMPWTFGSFYDLDSQLIQSICFKAAGINPHAPLLGQVDPTGFTGIHISFAGAALSSVPSLDADNTGWVPWAYTVSAGLPAAVGYVHTLTQTASGGGSPTLYQNFKLNNTAPPNGFDNFSLYSFDDATGTMTYSFNPPVALLPYIGTNISIQFTLNLIAKTLCQSSTGPVHETIWIEWQINSGPLNLELIDELSSTTSGQTKGSLLYPTVHNFIVSPVNVGDIIKMRLKYDSSGNLSHHLDILSSGWVNVDPGITGASPWQYDSATQQWANRRNTNGSNTLWQPMYSSLVMTGLLIQLGNTVNFKAYDKFRSYKFTDLLKGLIDCFNLSIQTDPVNKVITIEPTHPYVLPDGTQMPGYYVPQRLDWTNKQDIDRNNTNTFFKDAERQFDFQMKLDGSDGMQNIYGARYKGVYLNNKIGTQYNDVNNTNNEQGIVAAIPGSSRYMFPPIFPRGNKQYNNSFFSATMHYKHAAWANIPALLSAGSAPPLSPQLVCIIPENINDSSASAVTQVFEPKICYYAGKEAINAIGGWRFVGDPNAPYVDGGTPNAIGFELPYMFSVDYTGWVGTPPGENTAVLTYCDQLINGVVKPGLMKTYFLKRLAIMRRGKQRKLWMRLDLGDIINWMHRNTIIIDGDLYYLIAIENYNPLSDESCQCVFWKVENPEQVDLDNSFPSSTSILTSPLTLPQFDIKYAQLLMYQSDLPQVV